MKQRSTTTRLLTYYEDRSKTQLLRYLPVVVRLDGRSFHTFCRQFEKPYDIIFNTCLSNTLAFLCKKIQGVVYGQRHSDEVSLLLLDLRKATSDAFFDYSTQKIVSVTAAMCSTEFCRQLLIQDRLSVERDFPVFDCRAFNLPEFEVTNYFWDRSLDCVRNSIQNLARTKFSHKQLDHKDGSQMQEMLHSVHGINWAGLPQEQKAGVYCRKVEIETQIEVPLAVKLKGVRTPTTAMRSEWILKPVPQTRMELSEVIRSCCITTMEREILITYVEEETDK